MKHKIVPSEPSEKMLINALMAYGDDFILTRKIAKAVYKALIADCQEVEIPWQWIEGIPPNPYDKEWFIAKTKFGEKVVLRALPEEWTYDFKTADETYIMKENIISWMQFPDSNFIKYQPDRVAELEAKLKVAREALKNLSLFNYCDGDNNHITIIDEALKQIGVE